MTAKEGTLLALTGVTALKKRVQHPTVHERKDRGHFYWYFRYRQDEVQPDGSVKTRRKFHTIGPSRGEGAMSKKDAIAVRDEFLAGLNSAATRPEAAVRARAPESAPAPGDILFGKLAELWRTDYVEKRAAGKPLIATTTRQKYNYALSRILPRWKDVRLSQIRAKDVMDWLQDECASWYAMADLRNVMSGIITKAQEWELLPDSFANPIRRVRLPKKWEVREKRILTEDEMARVLAHIAEPNLLICETCLDTGTRISEVTALMVKHVDLERGTIQIAQRSWHGDIDEPKTEKSKRTLALGALTPRYRAWIEKLPNKGPNAWVFPQEDDPKQPRWDSGVRGALKDAAKREGLDFTGFGPHSLRRANITWRQEVGGSSIETSKIAGHASTRITEEYTVVQLKRQDELTRRIQDKRAKAAKRQKLVNLAAAG